MGTPRAIAWEVGGELWAAGLRLEFRLLAVTWEFLATVPAYWGV